VAAAQAKLTAAHLKPEFAASYLSVQAKTGTPWQLLAAVHKIETGQSGDSAIRSYAGAQGPMQFMPATFAHYAMDGDANGTTTITDFDDALLSAGNYLRAGGADKGRYSAALYNYNHSYAYVNNVMAIARRLGL
jgi:membrane-bound lytic murein transglycosylase B